MNCILFDGAAHQGLLPFTYTRPVSEVRIGILTITEKWGKHLPATYSFFTENYLQEKFSLKTESKNLLIFGGACPNQPLIDVLQSLKENQALYSNGQLLAYYSGSEINMQDAEGKDKIDFTENVTLINKPWDIFSHNGSELQADFDLLTNGRSSAKISGSNTLIGDNIFFEEGASAEAAVLNSKEGPIYLAKNASIMEGCLVRGSLSLGESSQLKMGAKIYGPTTVGPHSKVGGEVNNSVIFGFSNKGHDGFLGNSVIGEWCNLGADTNTSNLKNNYDEVKLWSFAEQGFKPTGLQFCGLMMGDHSKCGINTMFNTGTVVGVSCNIYGSGFPRNYIPSFSWGGAGGFTDYRLDKALATASIVMKRRGIELGNVEHNLLNHLYSQKNSLTQLP